MSDRFCDCGTKLPITSHPNRRYCKPCKAKVMERHKLQRCLDRKFRRDEGLCTQCGDVAREGMAMCFICARKHAARNTEDRAEARAARRAAAASSNPVKRPLD